MHARADAGGGHEGDRLAGASAGHVDDARPPASGPCAFRSEPRPIGGTGWIDVAPYRQNRKTVSAISPNTTATIATHPGQPERFQANPGSAPPTLPPT